MGIYPNETFTKNPDGTVTQEYAEPGLTMTRLLTPGPWREDRTDCFCCSCATFGSGDPFCRNHGFAGTRPCERHSMSGQADEDGVMPISVQAYRRRSGRV